MKYRLVLLSSILLFSCSSILNRSFTINPANYNYDYVTFNKKLDRNNAKYTLNITSLDKSNFSNGTNFPFITQFFQDELKENVIQKNHCNNDGKLVIPFLINYDITAENVQFLKQYTDFDYIILTKIQYLEELDKMALTSLNKKRLSSSKAGAISFLKIFDIKNNRIFIEMSCIAEVTINEARDMYSGIREFQPIAIHKKSYELGEKSMKKLLKRIK